MEAGRRLHSPWLHPEATPLIRDAIRLRYRLIPYLYSLMHDATEHGIPPLRPVFAVFDGHGAHDDVMVGPSLLACPVVVPGATEVMATLPAGPECWFDFWDGTAHPAGAAARIPAPLDRLPLLCPAGAILPMTDSPGDFARLHDEPSRCVRLFPGPDTGRSHFALAEDDGISADGPSCRVVFRLDWTPDAVRLNVEIEGAFRLPYDRIAVCLREGDARPLALAAGEGAPALVARAYRPG